MPSNTIKGLTVEIGGDTTKLGQALQGVESQSRNLSKELGQINKLLKMDPGNTDLMAQKQKVLAEAINATSQKLATLKEAEKQVQEQFARGEVSEEQVRALQREIVATEQKLKSYEGAAEDAEEATEGYGKETEEAEKKSSKFAQTLKGALVAALKAVGSAAAAAATAAAKAAVDLGKAVVESYAEYEQLVGGVETLFKDSSDQVMAYAEQAYKTAGLSANEYMETVTGFSASLIQSLGGDTAKAAEYADQAIRDMSDNANKMGTDMSSIQNAYQGFAKQNYTMLDNLKLGYGGTKAEMQRLLDDASKIAGVQFDISSYSDVIQAIHVMQENMDIAGTTAKEAEKTISGSINTTKAAYANLITGLGDSNADIAKLVSDLVGSAANVLTNIIPVIENVIKSVPSAIKQVLDAVIAMLPSLLDTAIDLFDQLLTAIVDMIPQVIPVLVPAIGQIVDCVVQVIPDLIIALFDMMPTLLTSVTDILVNVIQTLTAELPQIITTIVDFLTGNVDLIFDCALTILMALVDAIPDVAMALIGAMPQILNAIVNTLAKLPQMIWQILTSVISKFGEFISKLLGDAGSGAMNVINTIVNWFAQLPGKIWTWLINTISKVGTFVGDMLAKAAELGAKFIITVIDWFVQLPGKIWDAIVSAIQGIVTWGGQMVSAGLTAAKNLVTNIVNTIISLPGKMLDIGRNVVEGIWQGISGAFTWIKNKITGWVGDVLGFIKGLFGIHSPSTETAWMGKMLDEGLAGGLIKNAKSPMDAAKKMTEDTMAAAQDGLDGLNLQTNINARTNAIYGSAAAANQSALSAKLDEVLNAIRDGKVIMLDGTALVGGTASRYDSALGQTRMLAARGAV